MTGPIFDLEDLNSLARKIIKLIGEPYEIFGNVLQIGTSIGIDLFPEYGSSAQDLIANADAAMYAAKREGRGSFRLYRHEQTLTMEA